MPPGNGFALTFHHTMNITVSSITRADLSERMRLLNDPRVNRYLFIDTPITSDSTADWYNRVKKCARRLDFVFKDETGRTIAMAGLTEVHTAFSNAEFYIFVNPDLHGLGIGTATTSWVLRYAFLVLEMNKVYLFTDPENEMSIRLYQKLGFIHEGTMRKQRMKNGVLRDKLLYGILRDEWNSKRSQPSDLRISPAGGIKCYEKEVVQVEP